jgi:hypothetical protein
MLTPARVLFLDFAQKFRFPNGDLRKIKEIRSSSLQKNGNLRFAR